jgi:hypothetical protein
MRTVDGANPRRQVSDERHDVGASYRHQRPMCERHEVAFDRRRFPPDRVRAVMHLHRLPPARMITERLPACPRVHPRTAGHVGALLAFPPVRVGLLRECALTFAAIGTAVGRLPLPVRLLGDRHVQVARFLLRGVFRGNASPGRDQAGRSMPSSSSSSAASARRRSSIPLWRQIESRRTA